MRSRTAYGLIVAATFAVFNAGIWTTAGCGNDDIPIAEKCEEVCTCFENVLNDGGSYYMIMNLDTCIEKCHAAFVDDSDCEHSIDEMVECLDETGCLSEECDHDEDQVLYECDTGGWWEGHWEDYPD